MMTLTLINQMIAKMRLMISVMKSQKGTWMKRTNKYKNCIYLYLFFMNINLYVICIYLMKDYIYSDNDLINNSITHLK